MIRIRRILEEADTRSYEYEWHDDKVFSLTSLNFRDFATADSRDAHIHSRVNALSNIKRAIECRVDELLWYCCVLPIAQKKHWNFPLKLEVLGKTGILAPKILTRINQKRNQLEHQYLRPSQKDVQDGLDVMMLFLEYTLPFCSNIKKIAVQKGRRAECDIIFDEKHETITLRRSGKEAKVTIRSCATEDVLQFAGTLVVSALGASRSGPTLCST